MIPPRISLKEIQLYERPLRLRRPIRIAKAQVSGLSEVVARVRIMTEQGREASGMGADTLVPFGLDRCPATTEQESLGMLRLALSIARESYLHSEPATAYGLFAANHREIIDACIRCGLNHEVANFGAALLDRAILDALGQLLELPVEEVLRGNMPGIQPGDLAPDLRHFRINKFLASLFQWSRIQVRHRIPLEQGIMRSDLALGSGGDATVSGETLEEQLEQYRLRYFEVELQGDFSSDIARLANIARLLDLLPYVYYVTLDGGERFEDRADVLDFWQQLCHHPLLRRLVDSLVFFQQPLSRRHSLRDSLTTLGAEVSLVSDSDEAGLDSFPQLVRLGYRGTNYRSGKGLYPILIQAARCAHWNQETPQRYFLAGGDLATQLGVAFQQELAVACLLGLRHITRSGFRYGDGFAGMTELELRQYLSAHSTLYRERDDQVELAINGGWIDTLSLAVTGFATGVEPDWSVLPALRLRLR